MQYVRKKTGKPINFLLTEEMRNIIAKYQQQGQTDEDYIFPILDRRVHRTEQQRYDRTHKVLTNTNRWLRKIGQRFLRPRIEFADFIGIERVIIPFHQLQFYRLVEHATQRSKELANGRITATARP